MIIKDRAIAVYAKKDNKLCFFKIYNYNKKEEQEARDKFTELMNDANVSEYRMMTIERLSEILEKGCRVMG